MIFWFPVVRFMIVPGKDWQQEHRFQNCTDDGVDFGSASKQDSKHGSRGQGKTEATQRLKFPKFTDS
jgi:hypothetical protein